MDRSKEFQAAIDSQKNPGYYARALRAGHEVETPTGVCLREIGGNIWALRPGSPKVRLHSQSTIDFYLHQAVNGGKVFPVLF